MSDTSVTTVLILAEPVVGCGWEEMLRGPETRVWLGRAAISAGEHPEIVLTDAHLPPAVPRDEAGVIQVGGDGPADVRLSVDVTAKELRLACRLLGEVVRLRRLQRKSCETHRELAYAALTDPLTGLANRRAWDQELARWLTAAAGRGPQSSGSRLCLAVLDLDGFKSINDTQGHAEGDRVLQAVSRSLQRSVRQGDFVARLGGDEFGLLLWVPGESEAAAIVGRVTTRITKAMGGENKSKTTASAGFALSGEYPAVETAESLYLAADAALIAAKRQRGSTVAP